VTWSTTWLAVERPGAKEGTLSLPSRLDGNDGLGRDAGAYSTRNSSKGSLLSESHVIFRALASGKSIGEVRSASLGGKLLRQAARETRHRIWEALHWRFFAWTPPVWVIAALTAASHSDVTSPRFAGLVYVHFARRDRLTFDFVADKLWPLWKGGARDVRRDDVIDFLAERAASQPVRWRESTRVKLAGNVLSALRDFGLLTGVQRKTLQRPVVAPEVVLHLCHLLDAEGLRGRALLEARDWRLFFWDIQDTSQALAQLAQRGELRFERSGRTVVLDVPRHPLGEGR
jgi:bacteriophage exclusion system BrxA-like protein